MESEKTEDERQCGKQEWCASEKRAVEGLGGIVPRGFLNGGRRIVERRSVMIIRVVSIHAGLEQPPSRKRLVCLIGMECTVQQAHLYVVSSFLFVGILYHEVHFML